MYRFMPNKFQQQQNKVVYPMLLIAIKLELPNMNIDVLVPYNNQKPPKTND